MTSSWQTLPLQHCVTTTIDYRGKTPPPSTTGIPVITAKHVKAGQVVHDDQKFVSEETYERWTTRGFVQPGDVLVTTEAPVGEVAQLPGDRTYLITRRVIALRIDTEVADPAFVKYRLLHPMVIRRFQGMSHGTTVPRLYKEDILEFEATWPDLATQSTIASLLSAFDDLIANNTRRIDILEEIARATYREWFVEFRYPGHEGVPLVESELGPIPEGWEVAPLSDLSTKLTDGDWVETKDQGGDDFRLLQVSNVGVGRFRETGKFRFVTQETFDRLRCTEVELGDILISRMPDPVGRAWLVDHLDAPAISVVDVAILSPATPATGLYLNELLNSSATLAQMATMATGTTRARVTRKVISVMPVLRPPEAILEQYGDIVGDFARLKSLLNRQSDSLKASRDLLLPRLVSGEIDVSDLDLDEVA